MGKISFSKLPIVSCCNHTIFGKCPLYVIYIWVWNTENKHYSLKPTIERAA